MHVIFDYDGVATSSDDWDGKTCSLLVFGWRVVGLGRRDGVDVVESGYGCF